jgi:hypothetical protein
VSKAIVRDYTIDYSQPGKKWTAPSEGHGGKRFCVPVDTFCADVDGIKSASPLAIVGLVSCCLGMVALLSYAFMGQTRDMSKALFGAAAGFIVAWVFVLAAWAGVTTNLGAETTCYVQDDQNDGIVAAKGKLGDILDGTSYAYGLTVTSWVCLFPVIGVIVLRILEDRKRGSKQAPASDAAAPVAEPTV